MIPSYHNLSKKRSETALVIVDADGFYATDRLLSPQYRRFQSAVQKAGAICKTAQRVIYEIGGPEIDSV